MPPARKRPPGRAWQTDEAFREAARLVFARDGYLNAKISDIALAAGRSVASFYNYYDTKADLLIALAEEFHAEASQLAALPYRAGLSGEEALREAVAGFLAHLRQAARRADRYLPGGHGRGPLPGPVARAARGGHHPDRHRDQEGPGGRLLPGRRSGHDGLGAVGHAGALLLHLARPGRREGRAVRRRPGAGRPVHDLGEGRLLARRRRLAAVLRLALVPNPLLVPSPGHDAGGQPPERDDVVQRDAQEPDDGDDRAEQPGHDQDQVGPQARGEALGQQLDLLVGQIRPHQARPDRVVPQHQQHRRGQQQDDAVEGHRDAFGLVLADVFGHQPGGERQERDEEEQQQVQPHERGVGALEVFGDRVVREPGRADGGEAGRRRPGTTATASRSRAADRGPRRRTPRYRGSAA